VTIFARGPLKGVQTRVFLAPLEAIVGDPLARAVNPGIYRWDVRLQGPGETVFIEI
jgi:hypothetical protein